MILARVTGTVIASRKEPSLEGLKLLLVTPCDTTGKVKGAPVVAVDSVGAGVGEVVLFAAGSSARQTEVTQNRPVDHAIMAVVDSVEVDGKQAFSKSLEA